MTDLLAYLVAFICIAIAFGGITLSVHYGTDPRTPTYRAVLWLSAGIVWYIVFCVIAMWLADTLLTVSLSGSSIINNK